MAVNTGIAGNNFLTSFNTTVPKLFITAETDTVDEFDQVTLKHWQEEGFDIQYVPMGKGGKAYKEQMLSIPNSMPLGEYFGIIGARILFFFVYMKNVDRYVMQRTEMPQPSASRHFAVPRTSSVSL
jgi:hypothetical protein